MRRLTRGANDLCRTLLFAAMMHFLSSAEGVCSAAQVKSSLAQGLRSVGCRAVAEQSHEQRGKKRKGIIVTAQFSPICQ